MLAMTRTRNLTDQLRELGFQAERDVFRHDDVGQGGGGMTAKVDRRWLTLHTGTLPDEAAELGQPGLWKTVREAGHAHREFHLPQDVISQEAWDDGNGEILHPLTELIHWGRISAAGELPEGWECPAEDELKRELPQGALTVEAGPHARQGQLLCDANRLAVRFPLLQAVPPDLSDARRAWLDQLLTDMQNRCRLVRLAQEQSDHTTRIVAEVDLTGVPPFAAARLVHIGLDALRHVVSQMIEAVELLVDANVTSTICDFSPVQVDPAEGGA